MQVQTNPARPSLAVGTTCIAALVLMACVILGVRDAWVNWRGINGSGWHGGLLAILLTLLPLVPVLIVAIRAGHRGDSLERGLRTTAWVGVLAGVPVLLVLAVGAAY